MVINIEKWKNGKTYSVERDLRGRFISGKRHTFKSGEYYGNYGIKRTERQRERLYRNSWYIHGIPVHSTARNQNYFGFIIQGFSYNTNILNRNKEYLKNLLLIKAKRYLISAEYVRDISVELDYESPITISEQVRNNSWVLMVEHNGTVVDKDYGTLNL